jgi:hypothetical protein
MSGRNARDMPDDPGGRSAGRDPEWCLANGAHYRDLATWLREVAGRCRLPNPQRELLTLARRYERLADHLERRAR